jgi:hypothetical protein|tara:strand:+ start:548 stop:1318 length:771 start_codon:yes stop_codon:yes gene_type:complete
MSKDIIEKLRIDENYYGDLGSSYMSNSDIKGILENPYLFKYQKDKGIKGKSTPEMIMGRYFHNVMLEPEKCSDYASVDVKGRNTNKYRDAREENGGEELMLQDEIEKCELLAHKLTSNEEVFELIDPTKIEVEVPAIGMALDGGQYLWKGKADIINKERKLIVDLKTTSSLERFKSSAYKYNYHSQSYIYKQLFGFDMILVIIDKNTMQIAISHFSEYALEKGEEKVVRAEELFYKYIDPNGAREDAAQHLIKLEI